MSVLVINGCGSYVRAVKKRSKVRSERMQELESLREAMVAVMRPSFSQSVFDLWFSDLVFVSLDGEEAVFKINSDFKQGIINQRYIPTLESSLSEVLGFSVRVTVISSEKEEGLTLPRFSSPPPSTLPPEKRTEPEEEEKPNIGPDIESSRIFENYRFENFVVGESNKFAHAACVAVAQNPASAYNPLFIWGPSGLGKTHLLFAITNEIKRTRPNVRIVYSRADEFTNELIRSIQSGNPQAFRDKYRSADVLLIDDIQFIGGKEATQDEFFHTFNALYESECQIILTSDRPPKEIKTLEERLTTRFEWGLIADIQPPSIELRTAIILKKAENLGITVPEDVVQYLSQKLKDNIRTIEGAIKKIYAVTQLTGTPITLDMCKNAIASMIQESKSDKDLIERIFDAVTHHFGVTREELCGKKRTDNVAKARHMCMYIIRRLTERSLSDIGSIFSRDHTTVISSIKYVEGQMESVPGAESEVNDLIAEIKQGRD